MKTLVIGISIPSILATFGTWSSSKYCDYSQSLISSKTTNDRSFDELECQDWCHETLEDEDDSLYDDADSFCCDLEMWLDGSAQCYLYNGDKTIEYTWHGSEFNYFTCMTFQYGENFYTGQNFTAPQIEPSESIHEFESYFMQEFQSFAFDLDMTTFDLAVLVTNPMVDILASQMALLWYTINAFKGEEIALEGECAVASSRRIQDLSSSLGTNPTSTWDCISSLEHSYQCAEYDLVVGQGYDFCGGDVDDNDFIAAEQCCECDGGGTITRYANLCESVQDVYDSGGAPYNCDYYLENQVTYCGNWDDDDFDSASMCCWCGGGTTYSGYTSIYPNDDCVSNVDDTVYDSGGEPFNCNWYGDYPEYCGQYDDDDFVANDMCCECGGGTITVVEEVICDEGISLPGWTSMLPMTLLFTDAYYLLSLYHIYEREQEGVFNRLLYTIAVVQFLSALEIYQYAGMLSVSWAFLPVVFGFAIYDSYFLYLNTSLLYIE